MTFDTSLFLSALFGWPLLQGAIITVLLTAAVQVTSLVISLGTASLASSKSRWLRGLIVGYVWLFRGAPALLIILVIWNGLPQLFPVFRSSWFSPFLAAYIALSLIQIAYTTEILRSAYAAVNRGQREGAEALGLHRGHVFLYVVLPQALRIAMPTLVNELVSLVKTTSLAYVISLQELMTVTSLAISASFRFLEWYAAVLTYYLAIITVLTLLQSRIEHSLSRGYTR